MGKMCNFLGEYDLQTLTPVEIESITNQFPQKILKCYQLSHKNFSKPDNFPEEFYQIT